MNLSENKELNLQEQQRYTTVRNINIFVSMAGMVVILAFFSNVAIVVCGFLLVTAASGYFTRQQIKYEQGRDLKISLQFIALSLITAVGFWVWFLFT